eukprot:scaffold1771_cov211-Alexandrium_tamarense.AAC.31
MAEARFTGGWGVRRMPWRHEGGNPTTNNQHNTNGYDRADNLEEQHGISEVTEDVWPNLTRVRAMPLRRIKLRFNQRNKAMDATELEYMSSTRRKVKGV